MSSALMTTTISAWSFNCSSICSLESGLKARHAGSVVVVKQLAKLQVELVVKLGDPLPDMRRLHGKVLLLSNPIFIDDSFPYLQPKMPLNQGILC